MHGITDVLAQTISATLFVWYGLYAIFSESMVAEFKRYGLAPFRVLTGGLQVAASLGIFVGHFYRPLLLISAGGLTVMMLLGEVDQALESDQSIIISVLGTGESATNRALAGMLSEENGSLDDLDVSPTEILTSFIEKSFPIFQYEEVQDENGNKVSQLVRDSAGNPVINKEALAMKEKLLKGLEGLKMPEAALDQIINHYGTSNVAELTGRT